MNLLHAAGEVETKDATSDGLNMKTSFFLKPDPISVFQSGPDAFIVSLPKTKLRKDRFTDAAAFLKGKVPAA